MKLLLLCLLFGAVLAQTTANPLEEKLNDEVEDPDMDEKQIDEPEFVDETELSEDDNELSEGEHEENGERAKRCVTPCKPGHWCSRGGRRYVFISSARTWAQAHAHCLALSSTLATVHNRATENLMKALAQGRPTWIGLSDAQYNGYWFWINGKKVVFANWCRGEPNNSGGKEQCVLINYSGNKCWNDLNCMARLPYICERK